MNEVLSFNQRFLQISNLGYKLHNRLLGRYPTARSDLPMNFLLHQFPSMRHIHDIEHSWIVVFVNLFNCKFLRFCSRRGLFGVDLFDKFVEVEGSVHCRKGFSCCWLVYVGFRLHFIAIEDTVQFGYSVLARGLFLLPVRFEIKIVHVIFVLKRYIAGVLLLPVKHLLLNTLLQLIFKKWEDLISYDLLSSLDA